MCDWVKQVCEFPVNFRSSDHTIKTLMELLTPAAAHLDDRAGFSLAVTAWIQAHRHLIEAWRHYSQDKRWSPGPYFGDYVGKRDDPLVVGYCNTDGTRCDETHHGDDIAACVDFIYREASWVLHRRRVT
jgi:hypothetical protein